MSERTPNTQETSQNKDREHSKHEDEDWERDPLLIEEISLKSDFYTLIWSALRKGIWDGKMIRKQDIFATQYDIVWMKINFWFFITICLGTFFLIVHQVLSSDIEVTCRWPVWTLRCILVYFIAKSLSAEWTQGLAKARYTFRNPDEFNEPDFAKFIGLIQAFAAAFTVIGVAIFVCTETNTFDMVMSFTGMTIFSDLDDWLGGLICAETPHKEHEGDSDEMYTLEKLNERTPLSMKLSMLQDDLDIIDDHNTGDLGYLGSLLDFLHKSEIIIYLLPFSPLVIGPLILRYNSNAI